MLGFDLKLNDKEQTVYVGAQGTYEAMRNKLLTKEIINITPRHIVTESVYESSPGIAPDVNDPDHKPFLAR